MGPNIDMTIKDFFLTRVEYSLFMIKLILLIWFLVTCFWILVVGYSVKPQLQPYPSFF